MLLSLFPRRSSSWRKRLSACWRYYDGATIRRVTYLCWTRTTRSWSGGCFQRKIGNGPLHKSAITVFFPVAAIFYRKCPGNCPNSQELESGVLQSIIGAGTNTGWGGLVHGRCFRTLVIIASGCWVNSSGRVSAAGDLRVRYLGLFRFFLLLETQSRVRSSGLGRGAGSPGGGLGLFMRG